nr:G protein-activated inward rectifier potassium channel 3-like [Onthophagus taurus]
MASRNNDSIEVVSEIGDENRSQTATSVGSRRKSEKRTHIRPYASSTSRILKKCGKNNVASIETPNKEFRYIQDIGNTLLSTRWRWILLSLCIANGIAYVTFAAMWLLVAEINDDHYYSTKNNSVPCIQNAKSFTSYLLLSIETLTTIGYGSIYPNECQPGWIIITLQAITGVAIEGALVTAVFVKMSRPYNKHPIKHFSKKAVVCIRDGVLSLIFRVRDSHGKHWAKTVIKAVLIKRKVSVEGEPLQYYFENLKLEKYGLLMWPQEIIHKITPESPLWTLSPAHLYESRFEIMIVLEGDSTVTGQPSQSQTSYTNKEICWGYRFVNCIEYNKECHKYVIDHDKFSTIVECDTPLCSAKEICDFIRVASKPDMWDIEISTTSGISTPLSRRSEGSLNSSLRLSSYRLRKNDIDGVPFQRSTSFHRQLSGAPLLATITSEENLLESNENLDKKEYLSTNL